MIRKSRRKPVGSLRMVENLEEDDDRASMEAKTHGIEAKLVDVGNEKDDRLNRIPRQRIHRAYGIVGIELEFMVEDEVLGLRIHFAVRTGDSV
jgi:hypothetical protein